MAYEFTRLGEVEKLEAVPDGAEALVVTDGEVRRVPGSGLGGGGSDWTPAWYGWLGAESDGNTGFEPAGYAPKVYGDENRDVTYAEFKAALDKGALRFRWTDSSLYGPGLTSECFYTPTVDMFDETKFGYIADWGSYLIFSDTDVEGFGPFPLLGDDEEEVSVASETGEEPTKTEKKTRAHVPPRGK